MIWYDQWNQRLWVTLLHGFHSERSMIELFSRFCDIETIWELSWMLDDSIDWESLKGWNEEGGWLSGLQLLDRDSCHLNLILAVLNFGYFINQQISSHQHCHDILVSRFSDISTWYLWCYVEIPICHLIPSLPMQGVRYWPGLSPPVGAIAKANPSFWNVRSKYSEPLSPHTCDCRIHSWKNVCRKSSERVLRKLSMRDPDCRADASFFFFWTRHLPYAREYPSCCESAHCQNES
jgi:hypothetical protein